MAIANNSIALADLDFDTIKNNLKTFLQQQPVLSDYNFEGSALSVILDLLSYNTHYNAFYLNMIANEMFLDTCLKRSSAISYAKLLNYTPKSAKSSSAKINLTCNGVSDSSILLPKFTKFYSSSINGTNYQFVTLDDFVQVKDNSNVVNFSNVPIYQGQPISYNFTFSGTDKTQKFKLPDANIDTSTIRVNVYENSGSSSFNVFNLADGYLSLNSNSLVYFLQESLDGFYEIYFGDGILGKNLIDSNVIRVSYLTVDTTTPSGIGSFYLRGNIGNYQNHIITVDTGNVSSTTLAKESIDQIKFHAPKSFSSQKRAITNDDYTAILNQNSLNYTFDGINIWGGQENDPPVYGKVFICLKPTGSFLLTDLQKQELLSKVIKPVSVVTVEPTIVDPDYTFLQFNVNVFYDPSKTNLTQQQLQSNLTNTISSYANRTLNTFNSSFLFSDFDSVLLNSDKSILTNDITIKLQKRLYPDFNSKKSYLLNFGAPLKRKLSQEGVSSSPGMLIYDANANTSNSYIFIEEDPTKEYGYGIESINIINPGFNFSTPPTVIINGDGTGANAKVILSNSGNIQSIQVTDPGYNYNSASVSLQYNGITTPLASATVTLNKNTGYLRSYYYDTNNIKQIHDLNFGTIDYNKGTITLNAFKVKDIKNSSSVLTISANPQSNYIISPSLNQILAFDKKDTNAIKLTVTPILK